MVTKHWKRFDWGNQDTRNKKRKLKNLKSIELHLYKFFIFFTNIIDSKIHADDVTKKLLFHYCMSLLSLLQ